ncbi:hypothetical protein ACYSNR_09245 [Enterococcus sp. LJL128]
MEITEEKYTFEEFERKRKEFEKIFLLVGVAVVISALVAIFVYLILGFFLVIGSFVILYFCSFSWDELFNDFERNAETKYFEVSKDEIVSHKYLCSECVVILDKYENKYEFMLKVDGNLFFRKINNNFKVEVIDLEEGNPFLVTFQKRYSDERFEKVFPYYHGGISYELHVGKDMLTIV